MADAMEQMTKAVEHLKQQRDELQLKLHLAKADAKDEWARLEHQWEEMKPNSPRLDMVTHQRSLRANLTRSRDALADRDATEARRFLDRAQADLVVLEEFLNR